MRISRLCQSGRLRLHCLHGRVSIPIRSVVCPAASGDRRSSRQLLCCADRRRSVRCNFRAVEGGYASLEHRLHRDDWTLSPIQGNRGARFPGRPGHHFRFERGRRSLHHLSPADSVASPRHEASPRLDGHGRRRRWLSSGPRSSPKSGLTAATERGPEGPLGSNQVAASHTRRTVLDCRDATGRRR